MVEPNLPTESSEIFAKRARGALVLVKAEMYGSSRLMIRAAALVMLMRQNAFVLGTPKCIEDPGRHADLH